MKCKHDWVIGLAYFNTQGHIALQTVYAAYCIHRNGLIQCRLYVLYTQEWADIVQTVCAAYCISRNGLLLNRKRQKNTSIQNQLKVCMQVYYTTLLRVLTCRYMQLIEVYNQCTCILTQFQGSLVPRPSPSCHLTVLQATRSWVRAWEQGQFQGSLVPRPSPSCHLT